MSELLDNRAQRIRTLGEIISRLHAGASPDTVRAQLKELVRECDASEIAEMEQQLIAAGMPVERIMRMCDLHSQVAREILAEQPVPLLSPGHPVRTFQRENEAIARHVALLRDSLGALGAAPAGEARLGALHEALTLLERLREIDRHYARKENLLFSMLERHGVTGPSTVMWAKDDEARAMLRALGEVLSAEQPGEEWIAAVRRAAEPALGAVLEMIAKEEKILLPLALQKLSEAEWGEIQRQSPQYGWCLIDPVPGARPLADAPPPAGERAERPAPRAGIALGIMPAPEAGDEAPEGSLRLSSGSLTLAQLEAIFSTMPVDLTFVDAEDRVRFFSEGPDRVFVRSEAVIGRKVQHCHPPASVHVVNRILDDFRAGRQRVAEFWLQMRSPRERFVHVRYFAVRDEQGSYLGTLEVTQDLTRERSLTGERRLLQYETAAQGGADGAGAR